MFRILDRYIFLEWLKVFIIGLGVILGILIMQQMYDDLPELLEYGASAQQIVTYYGVVLPGYLPLVIPITTLVTLLFSVGSMHRNNEIVAMRSGGLSLWRISRSLILGGALFSVGLFFLNAQLVPWSVETSRNMLDNLRFSSEEQRLEDAKKIGLVPNLSVDNRRDGRLWFMNGFSERAYVGMGVVVHTRRPDGRETYRIMAREALWDEDTGYWTFLDGREFFYNSAGEPIRAVVFDELIKEDYLEDPKLMLALNKKPNDLSLFELSGILEQVPPEHNPRIHAYQVQYYEVLAGPFSVLVVVGLAIPFAVSGVRTNPMVGVSKSVGFFVIFYLFSTIFSILGERQILPAAAAAWTPYLVMMIVGMVLFHRAR